MKILVLGGTSFVGRHLIEAAVKKGHEVVMFNRGRTNPGVFGELRHIQGDRRKDAGLAAGEEWDAIFDTCAYSPQDLQPTIDVLKNKTKLYMLISTISVYKDCAHGRPNEAGPTFDQIIESDEVTGETYGPLKVMCEKLLQGELNDRALIIRPCLIVGPFDPTDRFTYYAKRLAEDGPVAVPGGPEAKRKVQWIDVRDLAEWIVKMAEERKTGIFNAASTPISMSEFIDAISSAQVVKEWIPDKTLETFDLGARRYPFWIPISKEYPEGFLIVDNQLAVECGLTFRPLAATAKDTRGWAAGREMKAGPTREQEEMLLNAK